MLNQVHLKLFTLKENVFIIVILYLYNNLTNIFTTLISFIYFKFDYTRFFLLSYFDFCIDVEHQNCLTVFLFGHKLTNVAKPYNLLIQTFWNYYLYVNLVHKQNKNKYYHCQCKFIKLGCLSLTQMWIFHMSKSILPYELKQIHQLTIHFIAEVKSQVQWWPWQNIK